MPDISMCCQVKCPLRNKCYRYRAISSEYHQSFMMPEGSQDCEHFWSVENRDSNLEGTEGLDEKRKALAEYFSNESSKN